MPFQERSDPFDGLESGRILAFMWKYWLSAAAVLVGGALLFWFAFTTNYPESRYAVKLGLDLAGGTELTYKADTASIASDSRARLNHSAPSSNAV